MNAIEVINTLKPLLGDYRKACDAERKAADEKAKVIIIIGHLVRELPADHLKAVMNKPFTVWADDAAYSVTLKDGLHSGVTVSRFDALKDLLPQEGGDDGA